MELTQTKFEIYIGLKNQDSYEELLTPDDFAKILAAHCHQQKIGFSMTTQLGGYAHNKGYVTETSLRITLLGIGEEDVQKLGASLKQIVNTDTIMITKEACKFYYQ